MSLELREKLRNLALFNSFESNPGAVDLVLASMQARQVRSGEALFREGDVGNELWVLVRGSIEITKSTLAGEGFTVAKLSDSMGVFFGEQALIDQDKRSATVIATSASEFLVLSREAFLRLSKEQPQIGLELSLAIAGLISKRLRKANEDSLLLFEALVNELKG